MEDMSELREEFKERIKPIIRAEPNKLSKYFQKNANIFNCKNCNKTFFVKERGLTSENMSIIIRFIRMNSKKYYDYCTGQDSDGFVLCYNREMVTLISDIHKEIFSQIANVLFTLKECKEKRIQYASQIIKTRRKIIKYWNSFDNGVRTVNNAYRKTIFANSKDILYVKIGEFRTVILHGHQVKEFLEGKRPEQKVKPNSLEEPIDLLIMGHYHRLGVFTVDQFDGLVSLSGSFVYPKYGYFPEMLSEMGMCKPTFQRSGISFEIIRFRIDIKEMNKTIEKNILKRKPTLEEKIRLYENQCDVSWCFVLGNHDPIDEIFIRKDGSFSGEQAMGDLAEFTKAEIPVAKMMIENLLHKKGFIKKTELFEREKSKRGRK